MSQKQAKHGSNNTIGLEQIHSAHEHVSINLPIGTLLANRYEINGYLGSGASAEVYRASDRLLSNLPVAIKVLSNSIYKDPLAVTRLYRELLANFDFDHDHIVRFYDCLRGPDFIALVMEYVEGGSLEQYLQRVPFIQLEEARSMLLQMCSALDFIHRLQIVHRDLKPANILLTQAGMVKLTDFGLVRVGQLPSKSEEEAEQIEQIEETIITVLHEDIVAKRETLTDGVVGSPLYIAPEYVTKGIISASGDIYAVGLIGYQLLTGVEPFPQEAVVDMMKAKLAGRTTPIRTLNPSIPLELAEVIEKAMQVKPERRFSSALEMRNALIALKLEPGSQVIYKPLIEQSKSVSFTMPAFLNPVKLYSSVDNYVRNISPVIWFVLLISLLLIIGILSEVLVGTATGLYLENAIVMLSESLAEFKDSAYKIYYDYFS